MIVLGVDCPLGASVSLVAFVMSAKEIEHVRVLLWLLHALNW